MLIAVARRFGTRLVLSPLDAVEQADSRGDEGQPAFRATGMLGEERSHARS